MTAGVYFVDDEPALAQRLADYLGRLSESLAASPAARGTVALLLSGGYGRGEGGVFRDAHGAPDLYNDLEFYMLLVDGGAEEAARAWCEQHERDGTRELGIDVEFKRLPLAELRAGAPSMFYYDLMQGHRLIWGRSDWANGVPAALSDASAIPLHEATRLLFNRGTGLFFSRCALARGDERLRNGFVERNHAKVRIALGDAVLAANGQYHHFCRERNRRVVAGLADTPPQWSTLVEWHSQGTAFKLSPRHLGASAAALAAAQTELATAWMETLCWLEGNDSAGSLPTPQVTPIPADDFSGNAVVAQCAAPRAGSPLAWGALPGWTDYPRAALLRVLVKLVDPRAAPDPREIARKLGQSDGPAQWVEWEPVYARWWAYYN